MDYHSLKLTLNRPNKNWCIHKIILILPEYYQKWTWDKTIHTKKTYDHNPDLVQAHATCGGVELVKWVPYPRTSGQRKNKAEQTNHNIKQEITISDQRVHSQTEFCH